jgi:transposase
LIGKLLLTVFQLQKEARQRNELLRRDWLERLAGYKAEQLVFTDESGVNSRTSDKTHGWAKKGHIIRHKVDGKRSENYSVLPALTVDGYIACNVYQGAVNAERFRAFLEQDLLPRCCRYPGPRSVIVMDNAAIHNVSSSSLHLLIRQDVRPLVERYGCKLEYLPPYSPDFNPIELSFAILKRNLKRGYDLGEANTPEELAEMIYEASTAAITPEIARSHFKHCMIYVRASYYDFEEEE